MLERVGPRHRERTGRAASRRVSVAHAYPRRMLILPPGHGTAALARRQFSRREKWMVGSVAAVSAAIVLIVLIALVGTGSKPASGCLNVDVPGPIGAQEFRQCGAQAREFCSSIGNSSGLSEFARRDIATACRKLGLQTDIAP